VIDSITLPICNRFHAKLANNGKITTFMGVPLFDYWCVGCLELRRWRLGPLKSMFDAKNFTSTEIALEIYLAAQNHQENP